MASICVAKPLTDAADDCRSDNSRDAVAESSEIDICIRAGVERRYTGHRMTEPHLPPGHHTLVQHDIVQRTGHKRVESLDPYIQLRGALSCI